MYIVYVYTYIFLISETYGHTGHNAAKEQENRRWSRSTFQCAVFVLLQNGGAKTKFTRGFGALAGWVCLTHPWIEGLLKALSADLAAL